MRDLRHWRAFRPEARRFLAGALLLEVGHAFLWALQNLYVRAVGHDEVVAGTVLAAGAVGVVLSTIPSASLFDAVGARRSLTLAAACASTALVGLALSEGLAALILFSGLQGAAFTLHRVVTAPFLVGISSPRERTHLFGAEFATHTVASTFGLAVSGVLAGTLEGGLVPEVSALRATLVLGGIVSLASVLAYRRLPDTPRDPDAPSPWQMFAILAPRRWTLWWRLAAPHLLVGLGAGLTIPFINLYFTDRFALPKATLGLVMAASQVTMTVAILATPRLVRRLGLLGATVVTEAASLPFFLTLAFTTSFPLAAIAFVLRTALMNLSHPLWRQLMMEVTPRRWRASVNGVSMLAWNLGWAVSNRLGGRLIKDSAEWIPAGPDGYVLPMLVTSGAYVLAIVLELALLWPHRQVGREGHGDGVEDPPAPADAVPAAAPAGSAAPVAPAAVATGRDTSTPATPGEA